MSDRSDQKEAPPKYASSGLVPASSARTLELPDLEKGAPAAKARHEAEERDGFTLLVVGSRAEDPRDRAERQAKEIGARAQAELAKAQAEAAGIREQARQEGYAQGKDEGLAAGQKEIQAAVTRLEQAIQVLDQTRSRVLAVMEPELVGLIQATVDTVLMTPGAVSPEALRNLVRQAVRSVAEADRINVFLSPADHAQVAEIRPELIRLLQGGGRLQLVAEAEVKPGECRVETPTIIIDATLETRRQRVFGVLADVLHQSPGLATALAQAADELPAGDPFAEEPAPEDGPEAQAGDAPDEDW